MKILYLLASLLLCQSLAAQQAPHQTLLISNALVFDGSGMEPVKGYDILIERGVIKRIGKKLPAPRGARVIDATGKTVIPGLIDMHGHLFAFGATQAAAYPPLYLAGGVTTIFTPGEFDPELAWALKDSVAKGLRIGPDILSAGPYFNSKPCFIGWMPAVSETDSIDALFEKWKGRLDGMKVYANITKEHFDRVMSLARQNKLLVTGHLASITARFAVEHGINGLEHGLTSISDFHGGNYSHYFSSICAAANVDLAQPAVDSLIRLIINHKVYMDPTMIVLENLLSDFKQIAPGLETYLDTGSITFLHRAQSMRSKMVPDSCLKKALEKQFVFNRRFYDQGGMLVAGTDPGTPEILPGFGIKREIILFMKSGIPLSQCIRIASLNGAIALGLDKKKGSIQPGKSADLSIINGDITTDINLLYQTEWVIRQGHLYKSSELLQSAKGKVTTGNWQRKQL